ncbi:MAG: MFS transporter [Candidatus Krumholzibacteriia bacterium]
MRGSPTEATLPAGQPGAAPGYAALLRARPQVLSFGVLLTLFSSFGQTFLISVFVPLFLASFSLNTAQFGTLYAVATLLSAASLPYFGRLLDRVALPRFSLAVGGGLALACFGLALAPNTAVLFLAVLGLRLTGQGLLSLTAVTTMARVFDRGRGRALSVTGVGYPLGEGLLPLGVVALVHMVGWRLSWGILGAVVLLLLLPLMIWLLRHVPTGGAADERTIAPAARRPGLLRDARFYALLPIGIFLPLVLTALFLYQVPLAASRGWSLQVMASAFVGFAVARLVGSLAIGPLIDRYAARRLFPLILVPVSVGLVALSLGTAPSIAFVYLFLAGVSQGIAGPVMTALWAEVYGVASLGATKGTVATIGVFATALGPAMLGALLNAGVPFAVIIPGCAGLGLMIVVFSLLVRGRLVAAADLHRSPGAAPCPQAGV